MVRIGSGGSDSGGCGDGFKTLMGESRSFFKGSIGSRGGDGCSGKDDGGCGGEGGDAAGYTYLSQGRVDPPHAHLLTYSALVDFNLHRNLPRSCSYFL